MREYYLLAMREKQKTSPRFMTVFTNFARLTR